MSRGQMVQSSWYNSLKNYVRSLIPLRGPLYNFLNVLSSIIESDNKFFATREALLSPVYGPSGLDKRYYEYFIRLSKYLNGQEVDIVDIGANHGWFVKISPRFFKFRKIFAYEPLAQYNELLIALKSRFKSLVVRNVLLG